MHATSSLTPATRPPPRISSETRKQRRVMAHQRGKSLFLAPPHRQIGRPESTEKKFRPEN